MYVQLKSGYNTDRGPAWITRVRFTRTWRTAYVHGRTLARVTGTYSLEPDANFYDVATDEGFWIPGPKRDRTDARHSARQPTIEADVQDEYDAFLAGAPLPGRASG